MASDLAVFLSIDLSDILNLVDSFDLCHGRLHLPNDRFWQHSIFDGSTSLPCILAMEASCIRERGVVVSTLYYVYPPMNHETVTTV